MSFLKAEWRKLVLINYEIDPALLKEHLPYKTELDIWKGKCYVSLVGFMFLNTKMLGISFPFHRNFEEVNLRFYVKYKFQNEWKRGVVFIKEIVPRPMLSFIANTLYKEHYQSMKMGHEWDESEVDIHVKYSWGKGDCIKVLAERDSLEMAPESVEEFIAEHYWGYTKVNATRTFEYEVKHPRWKHYPIISHDIKVDFGQSYGENFSFLAKQTPAFVMLAEGSEISVEGKRSI